MSLDAWDAAITQWVGQFGSNVTFLARLMLAAGCGSVIGLERELRGHHAGFRTHLLICLGSALTMVISATFALRSWPAGITVDPARIAYGVMTGMGFIGAGTIIQTSASIRGLTSAAAIWCVAAIGLAAGDGLWILTLGATIMVLGALWLLDRVEIHLPRQRMVTMTVRTHWSADAVDRVRNRLSQNGIYVGDVMFERSDDLKMVDVSCMISYRRNKPMTELQATLHSEPDMELLSLRGL